MMDPRNRILLAMGEAGHEAAMDAIRRYLVANSQARYAHLRALVADEAIEPVAVEDGAHKTPDGRPVWWYAGQAWAPRPEALERWHARRMAEQRQADEAARQAMEEQARRNAAAAARHGADPASVPRPAPGEGMAGVLCPVCQAPMAKQPICPACALGQAGYRILAICTQCGAEVPL